MTMATLALYPDQIVLKVASAISFRYKKYSGHLLFSNFHKISLFFASDLFVVKWAGNLSLSSHF